MNIFNKIKALNSDGLFSYSLTRDELQKRVAAAFPKTFQKSLASATLSDPEVVLIEGDDKIGFQLSFGIKAPLIGERAGKVKVKGGLTYNAEEKAVFVTDPVLEGIEVQGLPGRLVESVRTLVEYAMAQQLSRMPIYQVDSGFAGQRVKAVVVKDGVVKIALGV